MIEIREMTEGEAGVVAGLLRRGFRDVAERLNLTIERCPTFPAYIAAEKIASEAAAGTRFFILSDLGAPRGCIGYRIEGTTFWMVRLAVAPEGRHRGFGRLLLDEMEARARALGFGRVDLAVVAENTRLCDWYHAMGYRDDRLEPATHRAYSVLYMYRELAGPAPAAAEIEEELFRFGRSLAEKAGRRVGTERHFDWISARPALTPNAVYRMRFANGATEPALDDALRRVQAGTLPENWITGPLTQPADLARRLEARGFVPFILWSGMALELEELADTAPPEGIEIREVADDEMLRGFSEVLTLNLFRGKPEDVAGVWDLYRAVRGEPWITFFAALRRGEVVATAILFRDGALAGIHCVSTREDCRKRGIGRAVTAAALAEGRRQGARRGVLQASALGEPVYRKMGFEEKCRMAIYRYAGDTN